MPAATLPFSYPASALHTNNSPPALALHPAAVPFAFSRQFLFPAALGPAASASPLPSPDRPAPPAPNVSAGPPPGLRHSSKTPAPKPHTPDSLPETLSRAIPANNCAASCALPGPPSPTPLPAACSRQCKRGALPSPRRLSPPPQSGLSPHPPLSPAPALRVHLRAPVRW